MSFVKRKYRKLWILQLFKYKKNKKLKHAKLYLYEGQVRTAKCENKKKYAKKSFKR